MLFYLAGSAVDRSLVDTQVATTFNDSSFYRDVTSIDEETGHTFQEAQYLTYIDNSRNSGSCSPHQTVSKSKTVDSYPPMQCLFRDNYSNHFHLIDSDQSDLLKSIMRAVPVHKKNYCVIYLSRDA